jgi:hypothetical protein
MGNFEKNTTFGDTGRGKLEIASGEKQIGSQKRRGHPSPCPLPAGERVLYKLDHYHPKIRDSRVNSL